MSSINPLSVGERLDRLEQKTRIKKKNCQPEETHMDLNEFITDIAASIVAGLIVTGAAFIVFLPLLMLQDEQSSSNNDLITKN